MSLPPNTPLSSAPGVVPATNTDDGLTGISKSTYAVDNPFTKNAAPDNSHFNISIGYNGFDTSKSLYANSLLTTISNDKVTTSATQAVMAKYAPNADKPTTAAADPTNLKLPSIISQVDPNGIAQVMKNMMKMLNMVNMTASSNSPVTATNTVTDAFTGALEIMVHDLGFNAVLNAFNIILYNGGINYISTAYQSIVVNAFISLFEDVIKYGENGIPIPPIPPIVYGTSVPSPLVTVVPSLYVQQYYDSSSDPYPGYIQWLSSTGISVYTLRTSIQPPYPSAQAQILAETQQSIAATLETAIVTGSLTVTLLNTVLATEQVNIQNKNTEATLGSGSSANLMSLVSQILGKLGTAINLVENLHLPNSVLNQGNVASSLQSFSKNMSFIKTMQNQSLTAFHLPSPLSSLSSIVSLTNSLGSLGISIPALSSLASATGAISGSASTILSSLTSAAEVVSALSASGTSISAVQNQIASSNVQASEILLALKAAGISDANIASIALLLNNIEVG